MDYRKIVAATDFSPASVAALERAAAIAKHMEAELHVVHAVDVLMYRGVAYEEPLSPNSHKDERAAAERALAEAVENLGADHVPASLEVLDGEPRNVITTHAEKLGADLIVIGSHGHGRLHDIILGSVSGHISHVATCSVLIVKA